MDLDGDGFISMYEMEHFYDEQMQKMEDMGIDPLPFYDLLCQVNAINRECVQPTHYAIWKGILKITQPKSYNYGILDWVYLVIPE